MSTCCPEDIKSITTVLGNTVTVQHLDMRVSPPVLMDQATFDALTVVTCPTTETEFERVCLQPIGNTDAALVVEGQEIKVMQTTYSDDVGTVDAVTIQSITLWLNDGTEVTDTHEIVACPEPIVVETGVCVAP
jgi:hypothetical protein